MRPIPTILAALLLIAAIHPAAANAPRGKAEERLFAYDAQLPACDSPAVLGRIEQRFNERETSVWKTNLQIKGFDRVRATGFRPNGLDLIPRRYCSARVAISDGRHRRVDYYVSEDAGIIGWHGSLFYGWVRFPTPASFGLEWCVQGLDRHRTYAQDCRMARP
ncbi:MAG: hypothetical protein ACRC7G_16540 [Beijerinckiaceae bacterium]